MLDLCSSQFKHIGIKVQFRNPRTGGERQQVENLLALRPALPNPVRSPTQRRYSTVPIRNQTPSHHPTRFSKLKTPKVDKTRHIELVDLFWF